ncbi:zinc-binding protein A33-like isoform X2 [Hippocampus comes]|uniref:zinc-binding protein A33-like isoform X2 n=1 Tax=Hippocampus comes TaxID=109280 RepID=UPI00094EBCB8|nr:PREDICTED: zinc-binding protein A33-like isoform X2 [Hippocampus comes]
MATHSVISREDLICPRCTDIYCFPVLLHCGHNVCKVCLQQFWEWKGCQECPVCQAVSVPKRPPINLALKIAADQYHMEKMSQDRCRFHEEKLSVYCQNDEEPICLVCQMSKQHKIHECCPLDEAAKQKKRQADENNRTIREEFQKLHTFLFEEEDSRLQVLAQEVEVKVKVMSLKLEFIEKQMKTLASVIRDAERRLKGDDLSFLVDYKDTKKKLKCNIREPEIIRDILINSAAHQASLKFQVWKKMERLVKYVPITLDPNTAQANLELSEELSCVRYSSQRMLPDNPERCTGGVCVLGAGGFVSGKHSWTVDVSRGKDWYIGVVRESIQRKGAMSLKPSDGVWIIGGIIGGVLWAQTSPRTRLECKQKPERVTVELDYDKGKVAFINAVDSKTIFVFKDKFTERIFPYFSTGIHDEGSGSFPLTICSQTVTVAISDK